jgi:hypothetical protein
MDKAATDCAVSSEVAVSTIKCEQANFLSAFFRAGDTDGVWRSSVHLVL